jgi:hypothetical protein
MSGIVFVGRPFVSYLSWQQAIKIDGQISRKQRNPNHQKILIKYLKCPMIVLTTSFSFKLDKFHFFLFQRERDVSNEISSKQMILNVTKMQ